jgi:hypothetical protein
MTQNDISGEPAWVLKADGIAVKVYWDDQKRPRLCTYYKGNKTNFDIDTLEKVDGDLPSWAVELVRDWANKCLNNVLTWKDKAVAVRAHIPTSEN